MLRRTSDSSAAVARVRRPPSARTAAGGRAEGRAGKRKGRQRRLRVTSLCPFWRPAAFFIAVHELKSLAGNPRSGSWSSFCSGRASVGPRPFPRRVFFPGCRPDLPGSRRRAAEAEAVLHVAKGGTGSVFSWEVPLLWSALLFCSCGFFAGSAAAVADPVFCWSCFCCSDLFWSCGCFLLILLLLLLRAAAWLFARPVSSGAPRGPGASAASRGLAIERGSGVDRGERDRARLSGTGLLSRPANAGHRSRSCRPSSAQSRAGSGRILGGQRRRHGSAGRQRIGPAAFGGIGGGRKTEDGGKKAEDGQLPWWRPEVSCPPCSVLRPPASASARAGLGRTGKLAPETHEQAEEAGRQRPLENASASRTWLFSWKPPFLPASTVVFPGSEGGQVDPGAGVAVGAGRGEREFLEGRVLELWKARTAPRSSFTNPPVAVGESSRGRRPNAEADDADAFLPQAPRCAGFQSSSVASPSAEHDEKAVGPPCPR